MPVEFTILTQRQLALFTYSGFVTLQESQDVVAEYARHPAYRPLMRQLCDLTQVTGVEQNFPELLKMQARFAETLHQGKGSDLLVMFLAPTAAGQALAAMARKSWEGLNSVIVLVQDREEAALQVLGLAERRIADLVAQAL